MESAPTTLEEIYALVDEAEGVIFDNDGTMVDTMPTHYLAYAEAVGQFGLSFPEELFYELAGVPGSELVARLSREQDIPVSVEEALQAKDKALERLLSGVKYIEPTHAVLRYAKEKGIPVAIASGGERRDVLHSLEVSGVGVDSFDAVVTSEDVENGKPDPETFLLAASRLGVDPEKCIGFEDGALGMQGLREAGMIAVDIKLVDGYPKRSFEKEEEDGGAEEEVEEGAAEEEA